MKNRDSKDRLVNMLLSKSRLWSYDIKNADTIPDDLLIEKTLQYLDIKDINLLFSIYSNTRIKQVWLKQLVPQGSYLAKLNALLAWMYFDIKKPESYLKNKENQYLKSIK